MKRALKILFISLCFINYFAFANENSNEIRNKAYALYATKNYNEAFELFDSLNSTEKTAEIFLLMANIKQELNDEIGAIQYLNKALDIDYTYYKAYYNLGIIFAMKNSYPLAINNFELAIKYNREFHPAYYNLATCQIKLKNYEQAKKNLIKAIEIEPKNKDYHFNLAYCYKQLNKIKTAKRIINVYNSLG